MPVLVSVHPQRRLAYFRPIGTIETSSIASAFLNYVAGPDFDPGFVLLSDSSRLDDVNMSFRQMLGYVLRLSNHLDRIDRDTPIVLHARTDTFYGLNRMIEATVGTVSRVEFVVLRDERAALEAAGQPEPDFAGLRATLGLGDAGAEKAVSVIVP